MRLGSDVREVVDPRDLAGLLDTIAILNHRTEVYDRFIRTRARYAHSPFP
jgi:hypothetical protein